MAKRRLKSKRAKDKEQKKGKKKWIFALIILLIIISVIVTMFLGGDQSIKEFFSEVEPPSEPMKNIEVQWDNSNQEQLIPEIEPERIPVAAKPKRTKKRRKGYYIKVEDCMVTGCQREVLRYLKSENLPSYKRTYREQVTYFELISSTVYTLRRARQKISILKKYNSELNSPYPVKYKGRYRISFGLFLKEEVGIRMKTNLAQQYPNVQMRFKLEPVTRKYKVTTVFTGPFSNSRADQVLEYLQDNPEYESSKRVVLKR